MKKQTQRSGIAGVAQSQAARKGRARIQTQVDYSWFMLLTANIVAVEWLPTRGLWQTSLLSYLSPVTRPIESEMLGKGLAKSSYFVAQHIPPNFFLPT